MIPPAAAKSFDELTLGLFPLSALEGDAAEAEVGHRAFSLPPRGLKIALGCWFGFLFTIPFFLLACAFWASAGLLILCNWDQFLSKLPSFQDFFKTEDRAEVERRCDAEGMICEWHDDVLRVKNYTEAVRVHPQRGTKVVWQSHRRLAKQKTIGT